jgi:peptidyl-prolyl cis-trans isomerase C
VIVSPALQRGISIPAGSRNLPAIDLGIILPMYSKPMAGIPSQTTQSAFHRSGFSGIRAVHVRTVRVLASLFVFVLLLGLAACSSPFAPRLTPTPTVPSPTPAPPTATPEPMAATINGEGLTSNEFVAQVAQYKVAQTSLGKTVTDEDASKAVLEDLIAQVLLAQGARAAGFELSDSALQTRVEALQAQLGGADKLSKWEVDHGYPSASYFLLALRRSAEAAWMRDKIVTAVPKTADQVHVQQILLYNEGDANAVLEQLKIGGDFNALAAQYDPNTRGDLGWFPKGYLLEPAIEEAAFSLQVGSYSEVIQTGVGYSIIKVLDHDPNHALAPDAFLALQQSALKDWVSQQRAAATVVLAP